MIKTKKIKFGLGAMMLGLMLLLPGQNVQAADKEDAVEISEDKVYKESISTGDEEDWFTFTAEDKDCYYTFSITNENIQDASWYARFGYALYDENGKRILYHELGFESTNTFNIKFSRGEKFYLKTFTSDGATGKYNFKYTINDDTADTMEAAKEAVAGKKHSDSIDTGDDADWYTFTAEDKDCYYTFSITNENIQDASWYARFGYALYNEDSECIFSGSVNNASTYDFDKKLPKGEKLYLKLFTSDGATGKYNFKYTINDDTADTMEAAKEAVAGKKHSDSIDTGDDVDWYTFTAEDKDCYYTFSLTSENIQDASWYARFGYDLYNEDSECIFSGRVETASTYIFNEKLPKGEKLYLKLFTYDGATGKYNFMYTINDDIADSKNDAKLIEPEKKYSEDICVNNENDWYKIDATYSEYTFALNNVNNDGEVNLYVYNSEDKELMRIYAGKGKAANKTINLEKSQTLYVKITSGRTGDYKFSYTEGGNYLNYSDGLYLMDDGRWALYKDGAVNTAFTSLYYDENLGWWYVENGYINFAYNGFIQYEGQWWCVCGGRVCLDYTGLWCDPVVGWWYVSNGIIDFTYNGFSFFADQWWCVYNGSIAFGYTGLWCDPNLGWWYVNNGMIDFSYSGFSFFADQWWCVYNGSIAFGYTGLWCDPNLGWWYVENGVINFGYTGTVINDGMNWNVVNGMVIF